MKRIDPMQEFVYTSITLGEDVCVSLRYHYETDSSELVSAKLGTEWIESDPESLTGKRILK